MTSSIIDLAPNHKSGLVVANPILLGGGVVGCGESVADPLRDAGCGAMVVGPFTLSSRRGRPTNRLADSAGGFVLDTGLQNRGARSAIKRFARVWRRIGAPVVAQIALTDDDDARRMAALFAEVDALAGLELLITATIERGRLRSLVEALVIDGELPVWVKLPYGAPQELVEGAVEAGADAVVVAQPPIGMLRSVQISGLVERNEMGCDEWSRRDFVTGPLVGPAVYPLILHTLAEIPFQEMGIPLIVSASFHTWEDVATALEIGAAAVQLDGALWVEPGLAKCIVRAWQQT